MKNSKKYFPADFPTGKVDIANKKDPVILFVLSTACVHCQHLMEQLTEGAQIKDIYIIYDSFDLSDIAQLTGVTLTTEITAFPHAVWVNNNKKVLSSSEMYNIVFGQQK